MISEKVLFDNLALSGFQHGHETPLTQVVSRCELYKLYSVQGGVRGNLAVSGFQHGHETPLAQVESRCELYKLYSVQNGMRRNLAMKL